MIFDYFYPDQAEQFAFFRIPKVLFKDKRFKNISTDAKVLYGLMLDRVSLSVRNRWIDDMERVYIVYRSSSENGTYKKVYTTDNPEKSWYINTNRKAGQTWWYKVRGYKLVDGKKVYGRFSKITSYEFDWTEKDLVAAGEAYIRQQWPEAIFDSTLSSGETKTPYNGTSWLAVWPKRFCLYEPWEEVKAELLATIDADVKMQGSNPQDVWFYVTPDNDENWVTVYLLR